MPNQRFSINHAAELTEALSSELHGLGLNDPVVALTLRQLDVLRDSLARADRDASIRGRAATSAAQLAQDARRSGCLPVNLSEKPISEKERLYLEQFRRAGAPITDAMWLGNPERARLVGLLNL